MLQTLRQTVRDGRTLLKAIYGGPARQCPICGYVGPFRMAGSPPRFGARCPKCRALERHRLLALALKQRPIPTGAKVLHFAPEPAVAPLVRGGEYLSADIVPGRADLVLDLEAIALPDASVDVIVASHVLEHVDDAKTLREFRRILRPGGTAILMAPIVEGWDATYEDIEVTTEAERTIHFGQYNHVRYYGRDFRDRIRAAGLSVDEFVASPKEEIRHGLQRGERVFFAS